MDQAEMLLMRKAIISVILLLLLIQFPSHYGAEAASLLTSDKVGVLIFLNAGIDRYSVDLIKAKYYNSIRGLDNWSAIDKMLTHMRKEVYNYVKTETQPYFEEATSLISSLNGEVKYYIYSVSAIYAYVPGDKIGILKKDPLIRDVRPPLKFRINLDVAAKAVYADIWWDNGFNGSTDISKYLINDTIKGVEVAILDTGIDMDNPYLADRIIAAKDFSDDGTPDDLKGHGTFVAGIIASNHSRYRGIAAGVNLINAKCLNKDGEGTETSIYLAIEWALTAVDDGPEVINSSFGTNQLEPDGESEFTRNIDRFIDLYDVAWATAAGNEDSTTGLQLNVPGDFYNGLTVGAVNDHNTVNRDDDSWATFSCIGPTSDGRVKPDIVAPGEAITSTTNQGGFGIGSGTSFATPIVAGSLALVAPLLIRSYGERWYLAAKALLINSADDWRASGPDPYTGWGYLNLLNAWNSIDYVMLGEISSGETIPYSIFAENGSVLKITLTWNRHFNTQANDFYDLTVLNVTLRNSNNSIIDYKEYDSKNVIQMVLKPNETGYYYLYVSIQHIDPSLNKEVFSIASNSPIYLGLIASNLTISIDAANTIYDNEVLDLGVRVRNRGDIIIKQVKLNVTFTKGLSLLNQSLPINLGDLQPGEVVRTHIYLKPIDIGLQSIRAIVYYVQNNNAIININYTKTMIIDDDTSKPVINQFTVTGNPLIFRPITITIDASDESGISEVIVYYKINDPNVSDTNFDGVIYLNKDSAGKFVGELTISVTWIGKTIYLKAKVVDGDNDRPNDSEFSWSNTYTVSVPRNINIAILFIPVIFTILLVIAIKKRR